jgi:hypothetical protein
MSLLRIVLIEEHRDDDSEEARYFRHCVAYSLLTFLVSNGYALIRRALRTRGRRPRTPARRVIRGTLNRWPTGYEDCIETLGPREGPSRRTPEGCRRGAAGRCRRDPGRQPGDGPTGSRPRAAGNAWLTNVARQTGTFSRRQLAPIRPKRQSRLTPPEVQTALSHAMTVSDSC